MPRKDRELGPDNKEAGNLIEALHKTINSEDLKYYKDEMGDDESVTGVGKDIFGKYGFAEMEIKGKTYLMQIRDLEGYEQKTKLYQGMIVVPPQTAEAVKH